MNIDKLKPGRELDAIVAERVMKYRRKRDDCNTFWVDEFGEEPTHSQDYSTDIAAAWEVVKAVKKKGYGFRLSSGNLTAVASFTEAVPSIPVIVEGVTMYRAAPPIEAYSEEENPDPHAICLAALKAVGV